jgi:hypothetical protein
MVPPVTEIESKGGARVFREVLHGGPQMGKSLMENYLKAKGLLETISEEGGLEGKNGDTGSDILSRA